MREIKFRGQRIDGEGWTYGYYMENHMNKAYQIMFSINKEVVYQIYPKGCDVLPREVLPETVGQYTGLKDKNGVEIYEGDIILHKGAKGVVIYDDTIAMFMIHFNLMRSIYSFDSIDGKIEVIGNIHSDPELLK